jgi:outer membrane lipoprotein SlyB
MPYSIMKKNHFGFSYFTEGGVMYQRSNAHQAALVVMAMFTAGWVQAQTASSSQTQYTTDSKLAATRYKEDQKLCNSEPTAASRMQCKRDAKTEYDNAMASAKARMGVNASNATTVANCPDCAQVVAVSQTEKASEGSAVGMITGGVVGAVLGHQLGGGFGKDLATAAGAAGGAYAGKEIEKRVNTHKVWTVTVKMPNGHTSNFEYASHPGYRVGDMVRVENNQLSRP